jgi:hypothetical protein
MANRGRKLGHETRRTTATVAMQKQLNRRIVLRSSRPREKQVLASFDAVANGLQNLTVSLKNGRLDSTRRERSTKEFLGTPHVAALDVHIDSGQQPFNWSFH